MVSPGRSALPPVTPLFITKYYFADLVAKSKHCASLDLEVRGEDGGGARARLDSWLNRSMSTDDETGDGGGGTVSDSINSSIDAAAARVASLSELRSSS